MVCNVNVAGSRGAARKQDTEPRRASEIYAQTFIARFSPEENITAKALYLGSNFRGTYKILR